MLDLPHNPQLDIALPDGLPTLSFSPLLSPLFLTQKAALSGGHQRLLCLLIGFLAGFGQRRQELGGKEKDELGWLFSKLP